MRMPINRLPTSIQGEGYVDGAIRGVPEHVGAAGGDLARLSVFLAFVSNFLALFVGLVAACPIKLVAWLLVIGRGPGPPSRRGLRRVAAGQR